MNTILLITLGIPTLGPSQPCIHSTIATPITSSRILTLPHTRIIFCAFTLRSLQAKVRVGRILASHDNRAIHRNNLWLAGLILNAEHGIGSVIRPTLLLIIRSTSRLPLIRSAMQALRVRVRSEAERIILLIILRLNL